MSRNITIILVIQTQERLMSSLYYNWPSISKFWSYQFTLWKILDIGKSKNEKSERFLFFNSFLESHISPFREIESQWEIAWQQAETSLVLSSHKVTSFEAEWSIFLKLITKSYFSRKSSLKIKLSLIFPTKTLYLCVRSSLGNFHEFGNFVEYDSRLYKSSIK